MKAFAAMDKLFNFIFFFFLFFFISSAHLSQATDTMITISPGQGLSGNQTLVSKGGNFELGFFSPGNSHNYYIGIWYKKIPKKDVIWVGNRINPISNPSTSLLKLSNNGNLVLFNQSGSPVWSSNSTTTSSSNSTFAELLDTGNLVIRNTLSSSTPIWQSFDHPSHTWMPGAPLGVNKLTGEFQSVTSWKSSEDPSPGLFTLSLALDRSSQLVELHNRSLVYASTGVWNGQYFNSLPEVFVEKNIYNFSFVDNEEQKYATYILNDPSMIIYTLMDPSGQVKQFSWVSDKNQWLLNYNQPPALCDVHSACGAFGVCDQKTSPSCSCFVGYQPVSNKEWDLGAWSSGCSRKTSFQCNDKHDISTGDGFFEMNMVRLPSNPQNLAAAQSAGECEQACRKQCSCTAYAFDGQCFIWNGNLHNVEQIHDDVAETLYLRLAASDIPSPSPPTNSQAKLKLVPKFIFTGVAGLTVMVSIVFVGLVWAHRRRTRARIAMQLAEGSLIPFTYSDLQRMTKNFSDHILGRGGFGSVFKGAVPDSIIMAVKKLEGSRQGEKQFRTEVSTLGSIQHVNLVRLRGFCCEANNRLLVNDYMSGGSLDSHLFKSSKVLDWETRFHIILGVARALAYLHESCRECIIHCDIKPENVLLDNELKPKVADFGMAKLIGRDFSRVITTTRGTIGYLAPEWISGLPISCKVDVYSFGMMLFELISGERNSNQSEISENIDYFPVRVACQLTECDDQIGDLLDKRLQGEANLEQVWEADRPSMGNVVQILEGAVAATTAPVPFPFSWTAKKAEDLQSQSAPVSCLLLTRRQDVLKWPK